MSSSIGNPEYYDETGALAVAQAKTVLTERVQNLESSIQDPKKLLKRYSFKRLFSGNKETISNCSKNDGAVIRRSKSMTHQTFTPSAARAQVPNKDDHGHSQQNDLGIRDSELIVKSDREMHLYQNVISLSEVQQKPPPAPPSRAASLTPSFRIDSRPYVLHRSCALKATNRDVRRDVVIVYHGDHKLSHEWAMYLCKLLKGDRQLRVELQDITEIISLVGQLRQRQVQSKLTEIEERTYHAVSQIVIVDKPFLDCVYNHPSLIVGKLFRADSVLGLTLGVNPDVDVRAEHRACLLSFPSWTLLPISEDLPGKKPFHKVFLELALNRTSGSGYLLSTDYLDLPPPQQLAPSPNADLKFQLWPQKLAANEDKILVIFTKQITERSDIKVTFGNESKHSATHRMINRCTIEVNLSRKLLGDGETKILVRVDGKILLPDDSDVLKIQAPLESLESILENSSLIADSQLDGKVAKLISQNSTQLGMFQKLLEDDDVRVEKTVEKFPTLLHWAAHHGLEKSAVVLLGLPGAVSAATRVNRDGNSASKIAAIQGHTDLEKLMSSKLTLSRHRYEYPTLPRTRRTTSESYDVPRSKENWYLVPPKPVPVTKDRLIPIVKSENKRHGVLVPDVKDGLVPVQSESEGAYVSMKPRSNSTGSRTYEPLRPRTISASMVAPEGCGGGPRQHRARSLNEDILKGAEIDRPQSRHEFMKTFCNLSGQKAVLSDDYSKEFNKSFLNVEEVGKKEDAKEKDVPKEGSWHSLLRGRFSPSNSLKREKSKFATLPSKLPALGNNK